MITLFGTLLGYGILTELLYTSGGTVSYWTLVGISIVLTLVCPIIAFAEISFMFDSWDESTLNKVFSVAISVILFVLMVFVSYYAIRSFDENVSIANGTVDIEQMEKHTNTPISVDDCYSKATFDKAREKQIEYWTKEYKPLTKKEKKDGIVECRANLLEDWNDTMDELQSKYGEFQILGAKEVNSDGDYILQVKPMIKDYSEIEDVNKKKKEEEKQTETVRILPWYVPSSWAQ